MHQQQWGGGGDIAASGGGGGGGGGGEVRNIVDKTASFVARNGPEFEARIRQNEINNPKFNFLNPNDPYHAYYRHKVTEFKEGKGLEPSAAVPKVMQQQALQQSQQLPQKVIHEAVIPKEPPLEFEFIADPPSISAFDLDVVKLTAQFVARNGRQFLTQLMQKEQRNYQFDFLRPQHSLFNYFTKLVEQYTKILIPPKGLLQKMKREAENPREVMDQVRYRVEWAKYQERERKKEEEEREKERVAYAQIDWHDFVVVETVDFQPNEQGHFPPPTTPEELGARILIQERYDKFGESEEVEMEVESEDDEDEREVRNDGQPSQPDQDTQPPPVAVIPDEYLISPITGEKIQASKMQEHMRIGLLDPRWLEQRDRSIRERQIEDEVYAPGQDIQSSLKQLAERRTDIFGVEETAIGKKIGEEEIQKPEEKVTWDGHSGSMARTQQAAQANITLQEQIEAIHKAKGLVGEDDAKEKIGPSKPNEIRHQPPIPSPILPRPNPPITVPRPPASMLPPVRTTLLSAVPVIPRPPMAPVVRLASGQVLTPMPPMLHTPRINVVPMPPSAPHIMAPRPPPMVVPAAFVPAPPVPQPPAPAPPSHPPPPRDDEPVSKKMKTEDNLMPEEEFLRRNKGPVAVKVQVPNMQDKTEWKLSGQVLNFTVPLTDQGIFIKDSNSLAYYNMTNGAIIHLALKERGGRKNMARLENGGQPIDTRSIRTISSSHTHIDDESSFGSDSEINGFTSERQTDKYGFIGGAQKYSEESAQDVPPEVLRQREVKWLDMLGHWDKWMVKRHDKVRLRCQKGIPPALRGRAWLYLSGGKVKREQNKGKFQELDSQAGDPKWMDVIEKDLHRQFPFHEMFVSRGGHGQQDLFRVLKAYTLYRPEEGYCQAQAPIAAVLLMHMPAEEAIQLDGEILFALLRRVCPLAYRHLEKHKIDPILYMTEWFMCAFSRTLPWASVLRVWDMFLCDGVKIIFRVGLVLLKCMLGSREKLKACQGQYETMELLRAIEPRYMQEAFLAREIVEIPVSARDIEREHHSQLKRWRKSHGELNFKSPPRMHGARVIMLAEPPRRQDLQQNPTIVVDVPKPTPLMKKAAKTQEDRGSMKKKKKSVKKSSQTPEAIPNPSPQRKSSRHHLASLCFLLRHFQHKPQPNRNPNLNQNINRNPNCKQHPIQNQNREPSVGEETPGCGPAAEMVVGVRGGSISQV
ncbi:hypothetical protein CRUP_012805 [Coryphaenoides rupestris]|nr:hypothetical protein CRUP_012805 [Coryphaenoides rupestris]